MTSQEPYPKLSIEEISKMIDGSYHPANWDLAGKSQSEMIIELKNGIDEIGKQVKALEIKKGQLESDLAVLEWNASGKRINTNSPAYKKLCSPATMERAERHAKLILESIRKKQQKNKDTGTK
jgi:hypothetical protein